MKKMVWGIMEEVGKPNLGDYFPVLQKIDPQGIRRRLTTYFDKVMELLDGIIHERLELKKVHGLVSSNDVLDTLLSISEDQSEDQIDQTTIEHLLLDLFVAGTDTTSSTVEWAMTEILHNPETFSKARAELEQTIGKCQQLEESDITRLPYLQAIVKETFRLHPPSPLLVPRKVETDVEICGFTIPKGTQVLVNTWSIGRDPSVWEDPKLFKPERFLGSEIDVRGRDMELLPFGGGRRICPGMPLALRMVHLMLGSLINLFDWKFDEPENLKMEEKFGLTLQKARPLRVFPVCK
ncbi:geraniol 8-hydroxylase-like isoform X2 [Actinidia eriantha]|nr:geraniol 8-hydroxylase-like isoform X2 [Actinidia eriantha]